MNSSIHIDQQLTLETARQAMEIEARAIQLAAGRLNGQLQKAVEIILAHKGKIVITGVGKSGLIGQKVAATLCSTGTPAIYLHAGEAVHGDLGVYTPGDPTILISKSGASAELVRLIPILRQFESPLIGILGNLNSPLARSVDVVLDSRVEREADPLNLAPTASSAVVLALGDALAAALIAARGFNDLDFARYHPSGQLGRNLWLHVADVMHRLDEIARVGADTSLRQIVIEMTHFPLGAACVLDAENRLEGIITEGDLRRALQAHDDIRPLTADQVMTVHPVTITPTESLKEAVDRMENRRSQISVLPVVDDFGICQGLVRIHDIYQAELP
jgi:arabinose-5-phosphate isomerase